MYLQKLRVGGVWLVALLLASVRGLADDDTYAQHLLREEAKAMVALRQIKADLPTIFLASDSTAARSAHKRPQYGWGEFLGDYFDASRVNVINLARGGRSSRTFWTEGWWDLLCEHAKPGDWVLIQFGHNDATAVDSSKARGSLPGMGEESLRVKNVLTGEIETVHTFGWYLRQMVNDAHRLGLQPVLVAPTLHNSWRENRIGSAPEYYPLWTCAVAEELAVPFIDLSGAAAKVFQQMGPEATRAIYRGKTHLLAGAAKIYAQLAVEGLLMQSPGLFDPWLSPKGRDLVTDLSSTVGTESGDSRPPPQNP